MKLAPCVMVQGTASDVGKSVIATALCRVLREEGWDVAPFKAQNMSLNAAVTVSGGEIGRAQAVQAEAAGVEATVDMNPILLKPEADARSQLIVRGRARGSVDAKRYWGRRATLWPVVAESLRSLRRRHEVVVIEGAGSPVELNLRDLANMRVARAANAAVLLVADIERGGVFAQLLGTLDLLGAGDRARVRGLIVNKFRGNAALFDEGVRILQRRARLPVLGVLPSAELGIPSEDSVALDRPVAPDRSRLDIAVIRYPHISNFDDVEALARAGAGVRYVAEARALGVPDLVILPGSKTTIADLEWLRERGIAARVRALADAGVPIIGICGGFQMLGDRLDDPDGVEGAARRVNGLGLLAVSTRFAQRKQTVRVSGRLEVALFGAPRGTAFAGYELHMGQTRRRNGTRSFASLVRADGSRVLDGATSADGRIVGTYAHGLFGDDALRTALLRTLARRRGLAPPRSASTDPYAALSVWFRAGVDVPRLFKAVGLRP